MEVFKKLKALRSFEKLHLPDLETILDHDIVREIGFQQALGTPLTLKLLLLQNIGSAATVQRRIARLKRLGIVRQNKSKRDARKIELSISPEIQKIYRQYGQLLTRI